MEKEAGKPIYPTIEQFQAMSVKDKVGLFVGLPIPAQKLLVGSSSFAGDANQEMAKAVSHLKDDEFEEAKRLLSGTPYFSVTEKGRLQIVDPMREFIKTDLRIFWEEQQNRAKRKGR